MYGDTYLYISSYINIFKKKCQDVAMSVFIKFDLSSKIKLPFL